MKVLAINGSPHAEGSTYHALRLMADELEKEGIDVEIIHIGNQIIRGCIACNYCMKQEVPHCVFKDDAVNPFIEKVKAADGIILGSPVHWAGIGGTLKSFLDRVFYAGSRNLQNKVGAAVIAVRRSGGVAALDQLYHYLAYTNMALATSSYWNVIHGNKEDDVLKDAEGVQTAKMTARNMAWLLKSLQNTTPPALDEKKVWTNFIR
jgi:multimeric flavodoxin WrbA